MQGAGDCRRSRRPSKIFEFVVWLRETIRHQHQHPALKYSAADKIYMPLFASSTIWFHIWLHKSSVYRTSRLLSGRTWGSMAIHRRFTHASLPADEIRDAQYVHWLVEVLIQLDIRMSLPCSLSTGGAIAHDTSREFAQVFLNGTIPQYVTTVQELEHHVLHYNLADNTTWLPPVAWDVASLRNLISAKHTLLMQCSYHSRCDLLCR